MDHQMAIALSRIMATDSVSDEFKKAIARELIDYYKAILHRDETELIGNK